MTISEEAEDRPNIKGVGEERLLQGNTQYLDGT